MQDAWNTKYSSTITKTVPREEVQGLRLFHAGGVATQSLQPSDRVKQDGTEGEIDLYTEGVITSSLWLQVRTMTVILREQLWDWMDQVHEPFNSRIFLLFYYQSLWTFLSPQRVSFVLNQETIKVNYLTLEKQLKKNLKMKMKKCSRMSFSPQQKTNLSCFPNATHTQYL